MDYLITFGSIVGAFGVFDLLADPRHKTFVSEFIFGFHKVSLKAFEANSIRAILSFFIRDDRILYLRVLLWSALMSPIPTYLVFYFVARAVNGLASAGVEAFEVVESIAPIGVFSIQEILDGSWHIFLGFSLTTALLTSLSDYWNVWVGKLVYLSKRPLEGLAAFFVDLLGSMLPVVVLTLVWSSAINPANLAGSQWLKGYQYLELYLYILVFLMIISTAFLFAIRILVFCMGILLRSAILATKANSYTVLFSRAHEVPFSFIGIVVATIFIIADALQNSL